MSNILALGTVRRRGPAHRIGVVGAESGTNGSLLGRVRDVLLERERASGLSRSEFAKVARVPRRTYYEIIEGSANMRLSSLESVAEALDMSIYELLGVPAEALSASPVLISVRRIFAKKNRGVGMGV